MEWERPHFPQTLRFANFKHLSFRLHLIWQQLSSVELRACTWSFFFSFSFYCRSSFQLQKDNECAVCMSLCTSATLLGINQIHTHIRALACTGMYEFLYFTIAHIFVTFFGVFFFLLFFATFFIFFVWATICGKRAHMYEYCVVVLVCCMQFALYYFYAAGTLYSCPAFP